ncbi:hypothetical protein AVEN_164147-1, partial [Araneus ventricosus]
MRAFTSAVNWVNPTSGVFSYVCLGSEQWLKNSRWYSPDDSCIRRDESWTRETGTRDEIRKRGNKASCPSTRRNSTNGWADLINASQLVASLRGSAEEVLQGITADKFTDLVTIENTLESRFGDSHLKQSKRTELKTRRQKPRESFQVLAADVERVMSLVYAEYPVPESLA